MGPVKIAYICGSGHSGSTLFDLLLGSQPGFRSFGEIERTLLKIGKGEPTTCTCGAAGPDCDFWSEVLARLHRHGLAPGQKAPVRALLARVGGGTWSRTRLELRLLYRALRDCSNCRVVVDSSKSLRHLLVLQSIRDLDVYPIHLVRDGRAVAFSNARKGRDLVAGAAAWKKSNDQIVQALGSNGNGKPIRVRYEDLVTGPAVELARVTGALGHAAKDIELDWRARETHVLKGNRMRFSESATIVPDLDYIQEIDDPAWQEMTGLLRPLLSAFGYPESKSGMRSFMEMRGRKGSSSTAIAS
jgi:hypothetical protein